MQVAGNAAAMVVALEPAPGMGGSNDGRLGLTGSTGSPLQLVLKLCGLAAGSGSNQRVVSGRVSLAFFLARLYQK